MAEERTEFDKRIPGGVEPAEGERNASGRDEDPPQRDGGASEPRGGVRQPGGIDDQDVTASGDAATGD